MGIIRQLDEQTANMIAAGEVVERPMGVVKELVENAIDAGAKRITVSVEEGGIASLTVSDDGCGMDSRDAVNAFLRHATSKIRTSEDLWDISTLGFRGEALPSIASVSVRIPHGWSLNTAKPFRYPPGRAIKEQRSRWRIFSTARPQDSSICAAAPMKIRWCRM